MNDRNHLSIGGRHSRREFLRRSAMLAGAGLAAPWALDLAGVAGAADDADDYRALVCLFMFGGNDHYDTFVPNDPASHAAYAAARPGISRDLTEIQAIDPVGGFSGAGTFGFAPELTQTKQLFDAGHLGVVANLGTLVRPLDKAAWETGRNRPPQLFSHNDQQSFWQSSSVEGATTGWGGRIGDLHLDANASNSAFTCVSVSGNAVLLSGRDAAQYQVSSRGVTQLRTDTFRHAEALDGIRSVMNMQQGGLFPSSHADISRRALSAAASLGSAIDNVESRHDLDPLFPTDSENRFLSSTASQLKMVAKLIEAGRNTLGLKRQVFFVSMGGFDNHSGLVTRHRELLEAIDGSLASFHRATTALGVDRNVTTFTASDFGRTLASNGDGSDHGWGGHHIVMGGSVNGRRVYGDVPEIAIDGPDDVGRGRLLPTTSVDQYAATMARWMGAGSSELEAIVPNIANFDTSDLGFLRAPTASDLIVDDGASALRPARRIG